MSIQYDILDVAASLEGRPEAKQFDRICQKLFEIEKQNTMNSLLLDNIRDGLQSLKLVMKTGGEASS